MNTWYDKVLNLPWGKVDWPLFIQSVLSLGAIFAAYAVAHWQFERSQRQGRILAGEEIIRRIEIFKYIVCSVTMEAMHVEAADVYNDQSITINCVRILELRDTIRGIPIMDAPTSYLAVSITAIPAAIDELIVRIDKLNTAERSGVAPEIVEHLRGNLRHGAQGLIHMCHLARDNGEEKIEYLRQLAAR